MTQQKLDLLEVSTGIAAELAQVRARVCEILSRSPEWLCFALFSKWFSTVRNDKWRLRTSLRKAPAIEKSTLK